MVAVAQTFGSKINFHPHVHAMASRGGWTTTGDWVPVPYVDAKAAELLFRHKVLSLLRKAGVIDQQRIALLLSWRHSGFSVHHAVTLEPGHAGATERLVRYVDTVAPKTTKKVIIASRSSRSCLVSPLPLCREQLPHEFALRCLLCPIALRLKRKKLAVVAR